MPRKRAAASPKTQVRVRTPVVENALADVLDRGNGIGGGVNPIGFPGSQGSPWSTQLSQPTTMFKNLRWYLVSNDRQMLSEAYVELGLIQAICNLPVDDALRGGVDIKSKELTEEQIEELKISLDRDDDLNTVGQAAKWNRLFGGAGVLILNDQDPMTELDIEAMGPDDALEFRAVDMWELFWDKQNTEGYDPTIQSDDFEFYSYYGEQVHKSRVMRMKGLEAPSFIRPRLRGWGFSVVEILVRSINQYLKATDVTFELIDEFKVDYYKMKNLVNSLASPQGEQKVLRRVALANYQKNYQTAVVMDSEDDWDHKQISFTGMADMMAQIRMQVASDMRMPLTKLFGISASGFNSGEDDIEVYNAMIESEVRNKIKYDILRILEIKSQKLFGVTPEDLSIEFQNLRVLSATDEETVKTQKFARLKEAYAAGMMTDKEFKDACNKGNLFDVKLDTDEEIGDYDSDEVSDEQIRDPDSPIDVDDPGADRADSENPKSFDEGGIGKEPAASRSADKKVDKATLNSWEESKHPRADDGKFGEGSGGGGSSGGGKKDWAAALKKKHPALSGDFVIKKGGLTRDQAVTQGKALRAEGVSANIFHIDGPKTGNKSVYVLTVPASKANAKRIIKRNSSEFDRASYEADGGDDWIDPRRSAFFTSGPINVDKALWARAREASQAAYGRVKWQFVAWWYRKQGGSLT